MKKVEFFIVGQGLAGTMLAFEMLENKIDFRIISSPEKSKASMVAAGMINPLVFKRLTKSWFADDLLPVMKEKYISLENLLNEKFYFEKSILKPLSEQEIKLWEEKKSNADFSKYIKAVYNDVDVQNLEKSAGFGIVSGGGYVNLSDFLRASDRYFRERDLVLDLTLNFSEFNPNAKKYSYNNFLAEKIVFCEGYHIVENPLFKFVKLNPVKGEVLLIHAPDLSEEFILNKKVFVLPIGDQLFKVGSTYEWKDLTEELTDAGKSSITERLEKLITAKYSIKNHWAGIRPTMIDRRPVLGIHPEYRNIFLFNGLGTKGVMLAPYFAAEMLKLIQNKNYSMISEVSMERFLE